MFAYLRYSKQGYEIAVVGESVRTASMPGMNVPHIIRRTMMLSGGIAGLVGFLQVSGASGSLTENTAGGIGFTAITVAWLARLNPFVMVFIAALLAVLEKGADTDSDHLYHPGLGGGDAHRYRPVLHAGVPSSSSITA